MIRQETMVKRVMATMTSEQFKAWVKEYNARLSKEHGARWEAERIAREARARFYYTLNRFLKKNPIEKKPCVCGATRVQMHHPDYTEPFKVAFLCVRCHRHHHMGRLTLPFVVYDVREINHPSKV